MGEDEWEVVRVASGRPSHAELSGFFSPLCAGLGHALRTQVGVRNTGLKKV